MTPALELIGVRKDYRGLRPLRVLDLRLAQGEIVALSGFDTVAAEVMTNLITGATLPDRGEVRVAGVPTHAVPDADAWLDFAGRVGIVSPRVPLLGAFTVIQNIALALTLSLDPLEGEARLAAEGLASEVGMDPEASSSAAADVHPAVAFRVRLARAIALDPAFLVLEHPTDGLAAGEARAAALVVRRVARERGLTVLAMSEDPAFASAVADRVLRHAPATGAWRRQGAFGRLFG